MSDQSNDSIISIKEIKSLWKIILKNWYIVIISLVISYIAAYFYTYKLTDVYAATTQILLKSKDAYDYQSIIQTGGGGSYGGYKDFSDNYNAMRVVKSYDLIKKTIDKLDIDVSYFIKGRLRTNEVYESLPFKIKLGNVKSSLYEQLIVFKINNINEYSITYNLAGAEITRHGIFNRPLITTDFKMQVDKSDIIDQSTAEQLKKVDYLVQFHNKEYLVSRYQSSLSVEIPEYSGIIQLTVEDIIPQRAITFLDTLGKVYIDNTVTSKFEINTRTLSYIEKQLNEITETMSLIEDKLQFYKQKEAILDLNKEEENYFDQLVAIDTRLNQMDLLLNSLNSIEKYIIEDQSPDYLPSTLFITESDPILAGNLTNLYNAQLEKQSLTFTNTKTSSEAKRLNEKIEKLKNNLLMYVENARKSVVNQKQELRKQMEKYQGSISSIPFKQRELLNIERNLEVNQKMYSFLLEKKAENTIARAGIVPDSKIIESSRSRGVVRPDKRKITYTFIAGGFIISLIILAIRSMFYETLEGLEDLKQKTSCTVLGEIIQGDLMKSADDSIVRDPRSNVIESFRGIRTNLQFLANKMVEGNICLFTSNHPTEGKTFTTVNMGALLAKGGKKVLLLELDLHKPRIFKALNMQSSKIGITSVLIGQAEPNEIVHKTGVDNMDVMLAGALPPNASELILSSYLDDIFDFARAHYDFVMVDTPPVSLITDALYLMQKADVNVFVLNTKFPYRDSLNHAHEIYNEQKPKNFCFILNGVKKSRFNYYYKRYGSYYSDSTENSSKEKLN